MFRFMTRAAPPSPQPDRLIACPNCDAVFRVVPVAEGERLRCSRCRTVLIAPKSGAFLRIAVLAVTALILMAGAVFFPFLSISQMGLANAASVFQAALAFTGDLAPLSLAVLSLIVVLPVVRFAGLVYVTGPLAAGRAPLPQARRVYRLTEDLRPWSMAEVFTLGTVVAMVKVAGVAAVTLGPAFWAFVAMIIVVAFADSQIDRWTIWDALDRSGAG